MFITYSGVMHNEPIADPSGLPLDLQYWNAALFFLFPIFVLLAFVPLVQHIGFRWLYSMTAFDLAILSLATFRIIRMVVFDKIFSFARYFIFDAIDGKYEKPKGGLRRAVAELVECLWCMGVWAALAVTVLYFVSPVGHFFVIVLAISAIGSFLQVVSRAIGKL
jgi:hypothetical protein